MSFLRFLILLIVIFLSSHISIAFANNDYWQPESDYPRRFIVSQKCVYESCMSLIKDKKYNVTYGKQKDLWGSVEIIRNGQSGVFILLKGKADSVYLCSRTNGKCKFIISTEQLIEKYPTDETGTTVIDGIYDFELMTNKRIKIYVTGKGILDPYVVKF